MTLRLSLGHSFKQLTLISELSGCQNWISAQLEPNSFLAISQVSWQYLLCILCPTYAELIWGHFEVVLLRAGKGGGKQHVAFRAHVAFRTHVNLWVCVSALFSTSCKVLFK